MSSVEGSQWSADVVLASGDTVFIRPMTPADAPRLQAFHSRQSPESVYRRFFSPKPTMSDAMAEYFTSVKPGDRAALAVESGDDLWGWASYERWEGRDDAEVAFMVDDEQQGKGIATILLEHLAAIARAHGVRRFTAETLADNRAMLSVFTKAGWPVHRRFDSGVFDIDFDLTDDADYVDSVERREQRSDSRAMARLLLPRSIAMIGASETDGTVGSVLWQHLRQSFTGPLYAVNRRHDTIGGRHAYNSISEIPDDVWLAVIAVPVDSLVETIHECAAKRVRGAVIVTAVEDAEIDLEALVAHSRRNGMRLIGPASMGVASPQTGLQAALVDVALPAGGVAVSMQSGSLGSSLLRQAADLSMELSWFVSLGDKCDVSGNDLLQFWSDDESTSVIALYTESFGNPRKFARIARRVAMDRPIVAVRTGAAAVTDASGALYQQAGVIEVPTVTALLDTARVFATQPVPAGPNVAVVTNARSPGVLAEAALRAAGLNHVPPPMPLTWSATGDDYRRAVAATLADPGVDATIVIHAPPVPDALGHVAAPIDDVARGAAKPVLAVMLGERDGPLRAGSPVPAFTFPEQAAAVLGRMWGYSQWRALAALQPDVALSDVASDEVAGFLAAALDAGRRELSDDELGHVLASYGLTVAGSRTATSADEAVQAAHQIGYPVAMKAHRRHAGRSVRAGVALDLTDDDAVVDAFATMQEALGDDAASVTVQAMAPPGVDVRVRATAGDRIGPIVSVGLGGFQATVIDPGASRLAPLSPATAENLVSTSRVGLAMHEAGLDTATLVDAVVRLSQLAFQHPEIDDLEINPLLASGDACWVTDASVSIAPTVASPPLRRLN
jgi:acyl-CoA synthetase (NDP forming)/GNAT superfamily N-acetyltransferase